MSKIETKEIKMIEQAKINPAAEKYFNSKSFKDTKKDLLDQLDRNKAYGKYYRDLVDNYMDMWVEVKMLSDDIKKRGVSIEWFNGGGQNGIKGNDSLDKKPRILAQMIKTLDWLNLKPPESEGDEDDTDEDM